MLYASKVTYKNQGVTLSTTQLYKMTSDSSPKFDLNSPVSSAEKTSVCRFGEIVEGSSSSSNSSSRIDSVQPVKMRVKTKTSNLEDAISRESPETENSTFTKYRPTQIDSDEEDSDECNESNGDFEAVAEPTTLDNLTSKALTKEIVLDAKQNLLEKVKLETLPDGGNLLNTLSAAQPRTLGKKALATHIFQKKLIMDRIQNIHDSLATRPDTDPKQALPWMIWRESQKTSGGILANDMDLGNIFLMIPLLKMKKLEQEVQSDSDTENEKDENRKSKVEGGTLIICPATMIGLWESEISKGCKLNVEVHRGPDRATEATWLAKHDVVITTYKLVMGEHAKVGPLYGVIWRRIILDQAHIIRNHKTKTSVAVCALTARSRWALTGIPIHNKELDLYALLKFLGCSPFDDLQIWKQWVNNNNPLGLDILNYIMAIIMLRITKEQLQIQGCFDKLPEMKYEVISVELHPDTKKIYQKILVFSKTLLVQFLHQRNVNNVKVAYNPIRKSPGPTKNDNPQDENYKLHEKILKIYGTRKIKPHEILVYLLRLRQICCHPSLITGMLNDEYSSEDGIEEDGVDIDILDKLNNLNLEDEVHGTSDEIEADILIEAASKMLNTSNPVFDKNQENEKIRMTKQIIIEKVIPQGDKIIVVSQWTAMLQIVGEQLSNDKISFSLLDGSVAASKRTKLVKNFNKPSSKVKVLLLSLTVAGVGLNLVGANHILFLDFHWNPQYETQVQNRIYRIGQTKTVHVYKIVTTDTIEERIKALQENKLSMAHDILTCTNPSNANKLSHNDLKMLFSINDEQ